MPSLEGGFAPALSERYHDAEFRRRLDSYGSRARMICDVGLAKLRDADPTNQGSCDCGEGMAANHAAAGSNFDFIVLAIKLQG